MHYAKNREVRARVCACPIMSETLMRAVVQNVWSIQIVHQIWRAFRTSVKILAKIFVALMQYVT